MVGKWKDTRQVLYISTQFENTMNIATNKRGQEKEKPLPIIEYNTYMSGVDRQDQLMSYYPSERKTIRWYKKLLIHILQMGINNAHILYNQNHIGPKLTLLQFRLEIIRGLLIPIRQEEGPRVVVVDHQPTKGTVGDNGRIRRRRCVTCSGNGMRRDTIYVCGACPENPALCLGECFRLYHNRN